MSLWMRDVLLRDIASITRQLDAYDSDEALWKPATGITNSGGTLALHLCGNLRYFIGACLGNSGYERDRPAEFGTRNLSRDQLAELVGHTLDEVRTALDGLTASDLERDFPEPVGGVTVKTGLFLAHLSAHLAYHLGQMGYHRRITAGASAVAGMQSVAALATS